MRYAIPLFLFFLIAPLLSYAESDPPVEYKLAALDGSTDTYTVNRFKYLLDRLSGVFNKTHEDFGDHLVVARRQLKEAGVKESMLKILEATNRLAYLNKSGITYTECISAYTTLRQSGKTTDQAVLLAPVMINLHKKGH